jgi:hypothetical protein
MLDESSFGLWECVSGGNDEFIRVGMETRIQFDGLLPSDVTACSGFQVTVG